MPLFEYRCRECRHVTEFLEKTHSKDQHKCEQCGSTKTEKVLSAFAVGKVESSASTGASCSTGTCPLS